MSILGDRLITAVQVKPNERSIAELRALHHSMLKNDRAGSPPNLAAGALDLLLRMWDRIVEAEAGAR